MIMKYFYCFEEWKHKCFSTASGIFVPPIVDVDSCDTGPQFSSGARPVTIGVRIDGAQVTLPSLPLIMGTDFFVRAFRARNSFDLFYATASSCLPYSHRSFVILDNYPPILGEICARLIRRCCVTTRRAGASDRRAQCVLFRRRESKKGVGADIRVIIACCRRIWFLWVILPEWECI